MCGRNNMESATKGNFCGLEGEIRETPTFDPGEEEKIIRRIIGQLSLSPAEAEAAINKALKN